jgi:hypothetical protein
VSQGVEPPLPHLSFPTWTPSQENDVIPPHHQQPTASPLPGSSYWLTRTDTTPRPCGLINSLHWRRCCYPVALYICRYVLCDAYAADRKSGSGGRERGLYSSRHLPYFIKVGAKTTTKIPCSTLYTLFLYGGTAHSQNYAAQADYGCGYLLSKEPL